MTRTTSGAAQLDFPSVGAPIVPSAERSDYDLAHFTLADMVRCGGALRLMTGDSASMEEAAQKVTRYLYDHLREQGSKRRCCALVRLFKTHSYSQLPAELRAFAESMSGDTALGPNTRCLTLLASAGDELQWNSRRTSGTHQCIPLASEAMLGQFPMIAGLISQLGLTTTEFLQAGPEIVSELEQRKFGIFHVRSAPGSSFIPAQDDFVTPHSIASVLGLGGVLANGDFFALIIFTHTTVPVPTAEMFRTIALNLKLGFLAILDRPVFIN